jgi:hypothetical protein
MTQHVEHLWTIVCQQAVVDAGGGITLSRLIDMAWLPGLPLEPVIIPIALSVVSTWRRSLEPGVTLTERILLEHPDGTRIPVAPPVPIDLQARHLNSAIFHLRELPVRGPGQYWFVAQRDDPRGGPWVEVAPKAGLWLPGPGEWPGVVAPER